MTVATKKKFPWVRYLLSCISFSLFILIVFTDYEIGFVSNDESALIKFFSIFIFACSYPRLVVNERLSVWHKGIKGIKDLASLDFNSECFQVSLRWVFIFIAFFHSVIQ